MRLRDLRLAILTGLAGILHSTAETLLRRAYGKDGAAESRPVGGPPQHWLERVKDARVWYGTAPEGRSTGARAPSARAEPPAMEDGKRAHAADRLKPGEEMTGFKPKVGVHKVPPPPLQAHGSPEEDSRKLAPAAPTMPAKPRQERPPQSRFRLHPAAPESSENIKRSQPIAPTFTGRSLPAKNPETYNPPPQELRASHRHRSELTGSGTPSDSKYPQAAPGMGEPQAEPPKPLLRFEPPRAVFNRLPAQEMDQPIRTARNPSDSEAARSPWPTLTQAESQAGPTRTLTAGEEHWQESRQALPDRATPSGDGAIPARVENCWLELPPDPTNLPDGQAEREIWADEAREQQHEQKLTREQRGDLWSA